MNYLFRVAGVFLILGSAGISDYNTTAGVADPFWKTIILFIAGVLLIVAGRKRRVKE